MDEQLDLMMHLHWFWMVPVIALALAFWIGVIVGVFCVALGMKEALMVKRDRNRRNEIQASPLQ